MMVDTNQPVETGKTGIPTWTWCVSMDAALLARIEADARRLGVTPTDWLHAAAANMLRSNLVKLDSAA
jgi:hypothetical protein